MAKKKTQRQKLKLELDKLTAQYIRLRDKNTCQWCGKQGGNPQGMHVSHVIPRSAGDLLRWDYNNLKCLCFHCHISMWHKDPLIAKEWFKGKFPERFQYLEGERKKGTYKRWSIMELEEIRDQRIRDLKNWVD